MRFTSQTSCSGVTERTVTLSEIPGVRWTHKAPALAPDGYGTRRRAVQEGTPRRGYPHRFITVGGHPVVAVDAPNHGHRPNDEEFARITSDNRARMMAGDDLAPPIATLYIHAAGTADSSGMPHGRDGSFEPRHVGAGPPGYWGPSMGLRARPPRRRRAADAWCWANAAHSG
jgi:hypothetical protein